MDVSAGRSGRLAIRILRRQFKENSNQGKLKEWKDVTKRKKLLFSAEGTGVM